MKHRCLIKMPFSAETGAPRAPSIQSTTRKRKSEVDSIRTELSVQALTPFPPRLRYWPIMGCRADDCNPVGRDTSLKNTMPGKVSTRNVVKRGGAEAFRFLLSKYILRPYGYRWVLCLRRVLVDVLRCPCACYINTHLSREQWIRHHI